MLRRKILGLLTLCLILEIKHQNMIITTTFDKSMRNRSSVVIIK